ncbi:MAG TPA: nuclear transport factor 2 family protein [Myxococcaceae bacterium]
MGRQDRNVQALDRQAWAERLRSATARQPATVRRIVSVEVAGDVAVAKLHSEFPTHQFDDLVTLLRMGGRWRTVLKVFHRREPADAPLPTAAQIDAERQAIRGALGQVLQAMDGGDGARLGTVALARGQTYSLDRGELVAVSIPEWQARLDQAKRLARGRVPNPFVDPGELGRHLAEWRRI